MPPAVERAQPDAGPPPGMLRLNAPGHRARTGRADRRREDAMQKDHHPSDGGMSRRAALAGAAAGALALTSDPAAAQRCAGPPPPHQKGPLVWLDLDQKELDDAYDQSVYAFNAKNIEERRAANNEQALSAIGRPERVAYGPAEIEKDDIYKTKRANATTLI